MLYYKGNIMKNLTKKSFIFGFICSGIFAILFSCTSRPTWLDTLPEESELGYFVSSGNHDDADIAEKSARENINKVMEDKISLGLNDYLDLMNFGDNYVLKEFSNQQIEEAVKTNIKNMEVKNSYSEKLEDGRTAFYFLVAYNKKELEEEQNRVLALTKEKAMELYNSYLKKAKSSEKENKYYSASLNYTYAACTAVKTNSENSKIFIEELANAEKCLRAFSFSLLESNNKEYKIVKDSFGKIEEKEGKEISDFYISASEAKVPFSVSYTVSKANEDVKTFKENLVSSDQGFVRFILEVPKEICCGRIDFNLDMSFFELALKGIDSEVLATKKSNMLNNALQKSFYLEYHINELNN